MRRLVFSSWLVLAGCSDSGTPVAADASSDAFASDAVATDTSAESGPPPCTTAGELVQCSGQLYGTCRADGTIADCSCYGLGDEPIVVAECTWAVPDDLPSPILRNAISVTLVTADDSTSLGEVRDADDCTAAGGWVYDDESMPEAVTLCPASCEALTDAEGSIELAFGCLTR